VNIHTVQFSHILRTSDLEHLHSFLSRTVFVIAHKSERIETLLGVLWYLPIESTILIVTNCQEEVRANLVQGLRAGLPHHKKVYLIHQKDEGIAQVFKMAGISHILGEDGKVLDGKGEGMYIGALGACLLNDPRWVIFYDADNFFPSALLEYTIAMGRLFLFPSFPALLTPRHADGRPALDLHNVRVCWSSKPDLQGDNWDARIMGRCSRVVSPLFDLLLEEWFGIRDHAIRSSNAGEQGMTIQTAISLRFSSGFSVETFQLLDLLFKAVERKGSAEGIILQQYLSKSPHFHEKKGDEHIKKMIEESLGSFFYFETALPTRVKQRLQEVYDELSLEFVLPPVYPPLRDLPLQGLETFMDRYALSEDEEYRDVLVVQGEICA
jgi:mannosyl-3-phosphoglycerate synthase